MQLLDSYNGLRGTLLFPWHKFHGWPHDDNMQIFIVYSYLHALRGFCFLVGECSRLPCNYTADQSDTDVPCAGACCASRAKSYSSCMGCVGRNVHFHSTWQKGQINDFASSNGSQQFNQDKMRTFIFLKTLRHLSLSRSFVSRFTQANFSASLDPEHVRAGCLPVVHI